MTSRPTVVFGLDGAHFELLEPWLDDGVLPNIQSVIDTGCSGDLQAVLPPVTSPNWKAYATGKNPGKIGIFWWENIDTERERVYYPSARKHENVEFWELLATDDSVGVINVPTTHPPKEIGEFVISGPPDGEDTGFAHPDELEERLKTELDYRVLKEHRLDGQRDAAAEEILELIDLRFETARTLFEERNLDFLQVTTFYINSLQHFLWDDEYTRRGWERIDAHLGWFLERDCNVVLMSDHGSNPIRTVFNVNAWLEKQGYLTTDTGAADVLYEMGVTKDRLVRIATNLGIKSLAKRVAPRRLLTALPDETGAVNKEGKTESVVWSETKAIASGQGPIYLTPKVERSNYDRVRDEIKRALESLTDQNGHPVADAVRYGEEVYDGPYLTEAPDLVIDQAPGVHIPGGLGQSNVFSAPAGEDWRAENKRSGLFAASGPDFKEGTVEDLSILDLAPTLLHLRDHAIPDDMDGIVRTDVFAPGSAARQRDPDIRGRSEKRWEIARIRRVADRLEL